MTHNIVHGQIVDVHYWRGVPRLRQLLELASLRIRDCETLDEDAVEQRFADAGYGRVAAETIALSRTLLEQREEEWRSDRTTERAMRRAQRAIEQPDSQRWQVYRRLLVRNSRRVVENPRFVLQALRPSFWALEYQGIRRRLRVPQW